MSNIDQDIIELFEEHPKDANLIERQLHGLTKKNQDAMIFRQMFYLMTHLTFSENEAVEHWKKIRDHHQKLSKKLGEEVEITICMLDYFIKLNRTLKNPKIIEMKLFQNTQTLLLKDELTQLFNYRSFKQDLSKEFRLAKKNKLSMSLIILDIDNFKSVNDNYGHLIGDHVLSGCAERVLMVLKEEFNCYRYGGEEFTIILSGVDKRQAFEISEKIRAAIDSQPISVEEAGHPDITQLHVTTSSGLATFPYDASTSAKLIDNADKALYEAKALGKNQTRFFSQNLRRYERVQKQLQGSYQSFDGKSGKLVTMDISEGGLQFRVESRLLESQTINLSIFPGQKSELLCKVIRCTPDGREFVIAGRLIDSNAQWSEYISSARELD